MVQHAKKTESSLWMSIDSSEYCFLKLATAEPGRGIGLIVFSLDRRDIFEHNTYRLLADSLFVGNWPLIWWSRFKYRSNACTQSWRWRNYLRGVNSNRTEATYKLWCSALCSVHSPWGRMGRQERGGPEGSQDSVQCWKIPLFSKQSGQV